MFISLWCISTFGEVESQFLAESSGRTVIFSISFILAGTIEALTLERKLIKIDSACFVSVA